ncbi:MAG: HEAT repeat domain-containing protein [Planctomycetes bacterium]|nr:HEAT repeat domain-containing protein [Planctomycetota bacterium]
MKRICTMWAAGLAAAVWLTAGAAACGETAKGPEFPGTKASSEKLIAYLREARSAGDSESWRYVREIASKSKDPEVLVEVMRCLPAYARMGINGAVLVGAVDGTLTSAFTDGRVRRAGAIALSNVRVPEAFATLLDMAYRERDNVVARRVFYALSRLSGQRFGTDIAAYSAWFDEQSRVAEATRQGLRSESKNEVKVSLITFTQLVLPESDMVDAVADLLYDRDAIIRQSACRALAAKTIVHGPRLQQILAEVAKDDVDEDVRRAASALLADTGADTVEDSSN